MFSTGTVQWAWGLDGYHLTNPETTIPTDKRMQPGHGEPARRHGRPAGHRSVRPHPRPPSRPTPSRRSPPSPRRRPARSCPSAPRDDQRHRRRQRRRQRRRRRGLRRTAAPPGTRHRAPAAGHYTFTPLAHRTDHHQEPRHRRLLQHRDRRRRRHRHRRSPHPAAARSGRRPRCPTLAGANDTDPIELGVRFRHHSTASSPAIRFYKGAGNTGTHVGHLWSAGRQHASAPLTSPTRRPPGWQQASCSRRPVPITAGTTYVASYYAPNGHYAGDKNYFADSPGDLAPLTALGRTPRPPDNGVFHAGAAASRRPPTGHQLLGRHRLRPRRPPGTDRRSTARLPRTSTPCALTVRSRRPSPSR